jgi:dihydroxyacetone kinase-like predicted kinase
MERLTALCALVGAAHDKLLTEFLNSELEVVRLKAELVASKAHLAGMKLFLETIEDERDKAQEALAALVSYDPEASAESNARSMAAVAESVATGEITQAVRDTHTDAGQVTTGDWIGIVRGDGIVAIAGTLVTAASQLLEHLIDDQRELLTIITGEDSTAAQTDQIVAWVSQHRPDVAIEIHGGGQPLYPYLFGVE